MSKTRLNTLMSGLMAIPLSLQIANATSSSIMDEFTHYLSYGTHSQNFHTNLMDGQSEALKETILTLQQQEEKCRYSDRITEETRQAWLDLASQDGHTAPSKLLYLTKVLNLEWGGDAALKLAKTCHTLALSEREFKTKFQLAYLGFTSLRVHLCEPDYDLHKKVGALPKVITLLEDLKTLTASFQSISELPLPLLTHMIVFHDQCIPQAEICALLVVAHGGRTLQGDDIADIRSNIYDNGTQAIKLYQEGLKGQTTPEQRKYYHSQIVNLTQELRARTSHLFEEDSVSYIKAQKKSALTLARIYKDERADTEGLVTHTKQTFMTALAYKNAEKTDKALKYIALVLSVPEENSEQGFYINRLKMFAKHLQLQIENPDELLGFEVKHPDIFLGSRY